MFLLGIRTYTDLRRKDSRQIWSRKCEFCSENVIPNLIFQILPYSSLAWTMITFFTPHLFDFAYWTNYPLFVLLTIRILTGVCQAFHIPSLASIVSKHLAANDKGRVFGIVLAGSHWGTVLAGAIGSILLEWIGWRSLFQFVGILSLIWCWVFRWVLDKAKNSSGRSSPHPDEEVLIDKKNVSISE